MGRLSDGPVYLHLQGNLQALGWPIRRSFAASAREFAATGMPVQAASSMIASAGHIYPGHPLTYIYRNCQHILSYSQSKRARTYFAVKL
jgi:hypothetical protein